MNSQEMNRWSVLIHALAESSKREDRLALIAIFQFLLDQIYQLEVRIKHVENSQSHTSRKISSISDKPNS